MVEFHEGRSSILRGAGFALHNPPRDNTGHQGSYLSEKQMTPRPAGSLPGVSEFLPTEGRERHLGLRNADPRQGPASALQRLGFKARPLPTSSCPDRGLPLATAPSIRSRVPRELLGWREGGERAWRSVILPRPSCVQGYPLPDLWADCVAAGPYPLQAGPLAKENRSYSILSTCPRVSPLLDQD